MLSPFFSLKYFLFTVSILVFWKLSLMSLNSLVMLEPSQHVLDITIWKRKNVLLSTMVTIIIISVFLWHSMCIKLWLKRVKFDYRIYLHRLTIRNQESVINFTVNWIILLLIRFTIPDLRRQIHWLDYIQRSETVSCFFTLNNFSSLPVQTDKI